MISRGWVARGRDIFITGRAGGGERRAGGPSKGEGRRRKGEGGAVRLTPFCRIVFVRTHDAIDRRSLTMVRRIVEKIDGDPAQAGLAHAREVCERWVERGNHSAVEWMTILQRSWPELRSVLLDESEEGKRLRQTD